MPLKSTLTHFLCLPLATPTSRAQLQTSLSHFAAEVSKTDENGQPQIPKRAIRPLGALHFTIGVMSLQNPDRVQAACELLKNLDINELLHAIEGSEPAGNVSAKGASSEKQPLEAAPPSLKARSTGSLGKPDPLMIALTNLSPMQTPAATSCLYASPNPPHPIYPFAQRLHDIFLYAGFLLPPPNNRPLKLHATVVNTIYAKEGVASGKKRWAKGSGKLDATGVIDKWGETTWAEDVRLEKVTICEMGAKRVDDGKGNIVDEVYTEIASVALP